MPPVTTMAAHKTPSAPKERKHIRDAERHNLPAASADEKRLYLRACRSARSMIKTVEYPACAHNSNIPILKRQVKSLLKLAFKTTVRRYQTAEVANNRASREIKLVEMKLPKLFLSLVSSKYLKID